MDTSPLNIIILPDEETGKVALELSGKITDKYSSYFILDSKDYFPHITLLQVHYPSEKVEKLIQAVKELSINTSPFEIKMQGFEPTNRGFISWLCKKDEKLQKLHEQVVNLLDLKEHAQSLILENFTPHITITRVKDPEDALKAVDLLKEGQEEKTFKASGIVLGALGEHGTVNEILEEFSFKN